MSVEHRKHDGDVKPGDTMSEHCERLVNVRHGSHRLDSKRQYGPEVTAGSAHHMHPYFEQLAKFLQSLQGGESHDAVAAIQLKTTSLRMHTDGWMDGWKD